MKFIDKHGELPWATPKKSGYKGEASGLYFHFSTTKREAERIRKALERDGKWTGSVQYMPGHAFSLGAFVF